MAILDGDSLVLRLQLRYVQFTYTAIAKIGKGNPKNSSLVRKLGDHSISEFNIK